MVINALNYKYHGYFFKVLYIMLVRVRSQFRKIAQNCYISRMKIKLIFFKSSEHIYEKGDGPYRGFAIQASSLTI